MASISNVDDIERQTGLRGPAISHVAENTPKAGSPMTDIQDRAGQCCFLCLESPQQGQYAVLVPCLRPAKARQVVGQSGFFGDNPKPIYEKMMPWDNACESDNDIYWRLVDACYQYLGWWKRWLPYYGITEVLEVNVR